MGIRDSSKKIRVARPSLPESADAGVLTEGRRTKEFVKRVRSNQLRLRSELQPRYDFIVCGSGSSGSVVAGAVGRKLRRRVLLIEAGGCDDVPV